MTLKDAINKYLNDEKIVKESKDTLTDTWEGSLSKAKYFYLFPLDFVETQKYYFFDRRDAYLKMNATSLFVGPLMLGGFAFLLWLFAWGQSTQSLSLVIIACFVGFIPYLFNRRINEGLVNIVVLKKEWVGEAVSEDGKLILKGTLPAGNNYSFAYLLEKKDQEKMSFWDKLFSGLSVKGLNKLSPGLKFEFSCKDA
jgi:hypothetical protein